MIISSDCFSEPRVQRPLWKLNLRSSCTDASWPQWAHQNIKSPIQAWRCHASTVDHAFLIPSNVPTSSLQPILQRWNSQSCYSCLLFCRLLLWEPPHKGKIRLNTSKYLEYHQRSSIRRFREDSGTCTQLDCAWTTGTRSCAPGSDPANYVQCYAFLVFSHVHLCHLLRLQILMMAWNGSHPAVWIQKRNSLHNGHSESLTEYGRIQVQTVLVFKSSLWEGFSLLTATEFQSRSKYNFKLVSLWAPYTLNLKFHDGRKFRSQTSDNMVRWKA